MAANIWDNSDADNDGNNLNNWSLGNVPTTGDTMTFDNTTDTNCTFSGAISCDAIDVQSTYDGDIDFNDQNITTSGDQTYDGTGTVSCGTGTITCDGNFDNKDQGTWTDETSTLDMGGTTKTITPGTDPIYNFDVTGSVSIAASETLTVANLCDVVAGNTLTIGNGSTLIIAGSGDLEIQTGSTLDDGGSGTLQVNNEAEISVQAGTVSLNHIIIQGDHKFASQLIAAATYTATTFEIKNTGVSGREFIAASGTYTIVGDLKLYTAAAGALEISMDNNNANLTVSGDVIWDETGGGAITWTAGSGTITLSSAGSGTQDIDFDGATIETLVIDDAGATKRFTAALTTASFTGTAGVCDPNGQTITTVGACDWAATFTFVAGADVFNGCAWVVGGNWTADGQTLSATAGWDLQVTGTAVASGTGDVAYSDASGFTEVTASSGPWTDSGNNTNWDFGSGSSGKTRTCSMGCLHNV